MTVVSAVFFVSVAIFSKMEIAKSQRIGETFHAEIFYDKDDLNAGLYEGTVRGRRLFTSSAVPHGEGTIYFFNNDKFHRVNFTGEWIDGTREGNGTTYFKDGSIYKGEYFDGVEEGEGMIIYPDGNILEGEFLNGKIHGNAVFKYPNGDQREGFFFENVLNGQVIYTKSDGTIVIEFWKNGDPVPEKETLVRQGGSKETRSTTKKPKVVSGTEKPSGSFDLSALRNTIRNGDRTQTFASGDSTNREPKKRKMDAQMLRKITDDANRSFLFSVFNRVNG